jgi:histone-lysine N-methyltransferase SETMAR
VSDGNLQSVDQKICERQRFTISEPSYEFQQILLTVLYEIITVRLGYHKFCARWVPKMLTGEHKAQRMASALTFLEGYHKDGDEFLNHIIRLTGDETWVSFVDHVWITHIHQRSRKKFKQTSACQKAEATVFWDRTGKEC